MDFTQAQIEQKYNSLPNHLKDLLNSVEIGETVQNICENNGLAPEEVAAVMDETTLVILGLTRPMQFANRLVNEVSIPKGATIAISEEIEKRIFSKMFQKTEPPIPQKTETPVQVTSAPVQKPLTPQPTPQINPPVTTTPPPVSTPTITPKPDPTPTPPPTKTTQSIPYSAPVAVSPIEKQIMDAINTGAVYESLEKIGKKFDLHLDQLSDLNKNTEKVLMGQLAPELFIKTITTELEIPTEKAKQITMSINSEVIMKVRKNLQKIQTEPIAAKPQAPQTPPTPKITQTTIYSEEKVEEKHPDPAINAVEKAGGFTIEKNSEVFSSLHSLPNYSNEPKIAVDEIEEKYPVTDVSHLLQNHYENTDKPAPAPISETPPAPVEPKPVVPPTPKPPTRPPYTTDPYREQI